MIRKYDEAQTPYQRVLAAANVSAETKQKLRDEFLTLDPVQLLQKIHTLQDQLWPYAFLRAEASEVDNLLDIQPSSTQIATNGKSGHNGDRPQQELALQPDQITIDQAFSRSTRQYHRSHRKRRWRPTKRWWRTRKDPFEDVWSEVEQLLKQKPYVQAKVLFQSIQQKYPGKFTDGQLRTFQRRIRTWRTEYVLDQSNDSPEMDTVTSDDNYLR